MFNVKKMEGFLRFDILTTWLNSATFQTNISFPSTPKFKKKKKKKNRKERLNFQYYIIHCTTEHKLIMKNKTSIN